MYDHRDQRPFTTGIGVRAEMVDLYAALYDLGDEDMLHIVS